MIYAVNKRTKEHRVVNWPHPPMVNDKWDVVKADADGWIPWDSGECPLPDNHPYEAKDGDGHVFRGAMPQTFTAYWRNGWPEEMAGHRIIAYRPILDAKPEPVEWDGEGLPPVGCECEYRRPWGWEEAKVIGYDGSVCVVAVDGEGYFGNLTSGAFRPIRSEEDKAVDVMIQRAGLDDADYNRAVCRDIYRAGYRKT